MSLSDDPDVRTLVAGRRDPRYPAVREIIADFDWPDGRKMVPGTYAYILATRVMAAVVGPPRSSISNHTYEGPGLCRADFYGQTCGEPRDDHELICEGD